MARGNCVREVSFLHVAAVGIFVGVFLENIVIYSSTYSELWGKAGEKWTPKSRVLDFYHGGYHRGEELGSNDDTGEWTSNHQKNVFNAAKPDLTTSEK